MQQFNFPLQFTFKISTLANDFIATDNDGKTVAYVRQKMLKLKEEIVIYESELKSEVLYKINANKWLDFSAAYTFSDKIGTELGKVARKGWASIWRSKYEIFDNHQQIKYLVQEENAWVKVLDSLFASIPILGMFGGYFFNPAYNVIDIDGQVVVRLKKEASFWGRKFTVTKLGKVPGEDEESIILGLMMMILLERRRG